MYLVGGIVQEGIIQFFQQIANPFLDRVAEIVTMLGEEYFFIIVISFLYWNISKKEGFKLAAAFIYSAVLNSILKISFHTPRPFEAMAEVSGKRVHTAVGYSFPSGHTQAATTFFITLAQIIRRRWFTIIAIVLSLLVGLSWIYLGVHWPVDVIGGLIFGVIVSYIFCTIVDRYQDDEAMMRRIFFSIQFAVVLLTVFLYLFDLLYLKGSMKIENFFKISGISTGAVYGFFIQERHADFSPTDAGWAVRIIRYIIGLAVAVGLMMGLKLLLPEHYAADFLRYGIVGSWVTFLWPSAGFKIGLFNRRSRV